jgi:hypothetical protein
MTWVARPGPRRIAVATVAVLAAGCGQPSGRVQETSSDALVGDTTPAWICRLGSQGGFTGGGEGYVVHSDGRVDSWSRSTASSEVETRRLGTASADQMRPLRQALLAPELDSIHLQESGNLTIFFEFIRTDGHRRWTWPAGSPAGRTSKVPEPVQRCYASALEIARQVQRSP